MEAGSAASGRSFDHLREHSIGLPQVSVPVLQGAAGLSVQVRELGRDRLGRLGLALTFLVVTLAPHRLRDVDRVYVEDETVAPVEAPAAGGLT